MTHDEKMLDRMVAQVMDLDSPAYGDERERAVFMESSSFGLTTGLYLGILGAVIASLFGLVLLPVALLGMTVLPSAAMVWYAKRRGVDVQKLADHGGARSTMINTVVFGAGMVLTLAAMSWAVFTGQPLLPAPELEVNPGDGLLGGMVSGALVGGMLGGLAAVVGGVMSFRKVNRRREAGG